jgi:hypothetical protein
MLEIMQFGINKIQGKSNPCSWHKISAMRQLKHHKMDRNSSTIWKQQAVLRATRNVVYNYVIQYSMMEEHVHRKICFRSIKDTTLSSEFFQLPNNNQIRIISKEHVCSFHWIRNN